VEDVILAQVFQHALDAARRAGPSAFARVLLAQAPTPPGEEAVSVVLDLAKLRDDELRLLSQWEGE
jgi:hypothetical protein